MKSETCHDYKAGFSFSLFSDFIHNGYGICIINAQVKKQHVKVYW